MAHDHDPYPRFQLSCITEIIRVVRGGTVKAEAPLLCKCCYELTGAGLGITVGEPPGVEPLIGDADFGSDGQLQECQDALEQAEGDINQFGAEGPDAGIGPAEIAMLIQLAMAVLKAIRERRRQGS